MGYVNVDRMLAEVDGRQLTEWQAYAQIEPFGEERSDLRAAIVAWTMAEVYRDPEKQKEPYPLEAFMPKFGDSSGERGSVKVKELSPEAQRFWLELLNESFGGVDQRR